MKLMPDASWIDSAIVKTSDFQPVQHSSFNMMRNMALIYNKSKVTGDYLDKKNQQKEDIEIPAENYFDSSYPISVFFH